MSDYWFLIESRFSPAQLEVVNRLITASVRSRVNLYLVGGAVRDLTSGHPIRDLDFAVEGKPREILRHIKKAELAWVDYDNLRHCAEIVFSNGVGAEIGMCRTEHYARLGGRPTVLSRGNLGGPAPPGFFRECHGRLAESELARAFPRSE